MKLALQKGLRFGATAFAVCAMSISAASADNGLNGARVSDDDPKKPFAEHIAPSGKKRYIVQFRPEDKLELRDEIRRVGAKLVLNYTPQLKAYVIEMNGQQKKELRKTGLMRGVQEDVNLPLFAHGPTEPAGYPDGAFAEFVPWGRDRVGADEVWSAVPHLTPPPDSSASPVLAPNTITGEGIRVGVLDSGIDHDHPDLVDNIEQNCGSGVRRDFLPSNYLGAGNAGMDDCPEDDTFNGHGTSVASVIASASNGTGVVGVAPNATIVPYRVCDGSCPLSSIIGGLVQALRDEVDVVNMSYGGGAGFNIEAKAMQALNRAGVAMVASAGNGNSQVVQFPAGYDTVLAVGATDIHDNRAGFSNYGGWVDVTGPGVLNPTATCEGCVTEGFVDEETPDLESFAANQMTNSPVAIVEDAEIVFIGRGCVATAGDVNLADPAGKVALIERGACSFAEKVFFAEQAGAIGTIVHNNNPGNFFGTLGSFASAGPSVSLSQADGLELRADMDANPPVTGDVGVRRLPDLYWYISGTSFSSPHGAGVAALVKEVNPDFSSIQVRKIIERTAEDIGPNVIFANGMLRADRAVEDAQN